MSGPPGFTCWVSLAPEFSCIYCWVLIFALSPCYIYWFICSRRWCIDKLGVFHENQIIYVSWSTSEQRVRLAPWNRFKPSIKIFYWPFQGGTSFVNHLCCVSHAFASVLWCLVVTCWERADLLALVGDHVYCILLLSRVVSCVRCGTWLCRFLIFVIFLTFTSEIHVIWYIFVCISGILFWTDNRSLAASIARIRYSLRYIPLYILILPYI